MSNPLNSVEKIVEFSEDLEKGTVIPFEELDIKETSTDHNDEEAVNGGSLCDTAKEWYKKCFKTEKQMMLEEKLGTEQFPPETISSRGILLWAQGIQLCFVSMTMLWLNCSYHEPGLLADLWVYALTVISSLVHTSTTSVFLENVFYHKPKDPTKSWYFDRILALVVFLYVAISFVTLTILDGVFVLVMNMICHVVFLW